MADQPELFPENVAAATPKPPWRSHSNPDATALTRSQALILGLKRYTGGRPCKNGHGFERFASDGHCVQCTDKKFKDWYKVNSQRVVDNARRWRVNNPERFREQRKRELPANLIRVKKWIKENPEHAKELRSSVNHAYRARKRNASGRWTRHQIADLLIQQDFRCIACSADIREAFHRDHKMPLSLGGSNDISNIQLLCAFCNTSKGAKHPDVWARENGRALNG